jgi:hypothetical protein
MRQAKSLEDAPFGKISAPLTVIVGEPANPGPSICCGLQKTHMNFNIGAAQGGQICFKTLIGLGRVGTLINMQQL